ncbi:hypothetical protein ACIA8K_19820 [Catenuloplanes sp. NPDC051500]|uniref:hypothetical protein n=1 Tax=Catenuloplanes sp. NPDC051500 TaxID=3363959 RepID=UPI0037B5A1A2
MDVRDAAKRWPSGWAGWPAKDVEAIAPLTISGCTVLRFPADGLVTDGLVADGLVAEARDYSHARPERLLPSAGVCGR